MHLKLERLPCCPRKGTIWRGQFIIWPRIEMFVYIFHVFSMYTPLFLNETEDLSFVSVLQQGSSVNSVPLCIAVSVML